MYSPPAIQLPERGGGGAPVVPSLQPQTVPQAVPEDLRLALLTDDILSGKSKYSGICCAQDGRIFFSPWNAKHVLVFEPSSGRFTSLTSYRLKSMSCSWKFSGICHAPNGRLYCSPLNADEVLIIDPVKDELVFLKDP